MIKNISFNKRIFQIIIQIDRNEFKKIVLNMQPILDTEIENIVEEIRKIENSLYEEDIKYLMFKISQAKRQS